MAEDRSLDLALAALHGSVDSDPADDARFAKRIAAGLSNFAPTSRRALDPVLTAPFPDDHHDVEEFARDHGSGDDHHAAHAADAGELRGWEGSMSDDEQFAPNSLAGLSGLTRSGPASHGSSDALDGAAKGDDSGLIDLRAMSQPPAEEAAAADAAPATAAAAATIASNEPATAAPSARGARASEPKAAPAAAAPAAAAPAAVATASPKKGGAGLWIALGGLAAAAAIAAIVLPGKKSEETTASAPAATQAADKADKDKKDEIVAAAPAPSATTTAEPAAPAASAEPEPEPAATVAVAPTAGGAAKPGAASPGGAGAKGVEPKAAAPEKAAAAPPATDPVAKAAPAGGSLDDVLGLGKGSEPAQKKADPNENLPDRPDSMDVRSAINGKVGAARACVKGQDDASSVTVTFGPGGGVSGVAVVSGPAKGTGAETCIKNAFSSAKVPASKKGASGSAVLQP